MSYGKKKKKHCWLAHTHSQVIEESPPSLDSGSGYPMLSRRGSRPAFGILHLQVQSLEFVTTKEEFLGTSRRGAGNGEGSEGWAASPQLGLDQIIQRSVKRTSFCTSLFYAYINMDANIYKRNKSPGCERKNKHTACLVILQKQQLFLLTPSCDG